MGTKDPPLRPLTFVERYNRMWTDNGSIRDSVLTVLSNIEDCPQVQQATLMIENMKKELAEDEDELNFEEKYDRVRKVFSDISEILRSTKSKKV